VNSPELYRAVINTINWIRGKIERDVQGQRRDDA
jgi:hypothetical protein